MKLLLLVIVTSLLLSLSAFADIDTDQNEKIERLEQMLNDQQKTIKSLKRTSKGASSTEISKLKRELKGLRNQVLSVEKKINTQKNGVKKVSKEDIKRFENLKKKIEESENKIKKLNYAIKEGLVDKSIVAVSKGKMERNLKIWKSERDKLAKIISEMRGQEGKKDKGAFAFEGVLDLTVKHSEGFDNIKESNIIIDTFELGFSAQFSNSLTGNLAIKYEDSSDSAANLNLTQAQLVYNFESAPYLSMFIGKNVVPFGVYNTGAFTGTLGSSAFELNTGNFGFGYSYGGFQISSYAYKGTTKLARDDQQLDDYGARVSQRFEWQGGSLEFGADYISNILDSDTIHGKLTDASDVQKYIAGYSANLALTFHKTTLYSEFTTSADKMNEAGILFKSEAAKISTFTVEANQDFTMFGRDYSFFLSHQTSKQALALSLPEARLITGFNTVVGESGVITLEYNKSDDYKVADGGTGGESHDFTLRWGVGF